ncbi:PEP-CTERM sorting domain-containing protein [Roseateles cellulosilyticus]|uniref:PEP-CTERM sorting domain-containing protein n=1 Tax=Pelomonas cellulosilytica TaxID=2906762 RepID=A0ABS8XZY8_9BURK|nr:PEP-CTERM sorting domain-containing protein [Pelomonas sp. P8]MCE4557270.1 PEP-CTERM sorting domain-containing protein [Pelomonas sp. P8]
MRLLATSAAVLALLTPLASHALASIDDAKGDFLGTFAGSSASTDLDVLAASVFYNAGTDTFTLTATMDGNVGTTKSGLYVWGVNRGQGAAGFEKSLGLAGVRFDQVILLRPNGTGSLPGLPADKATLPVGAVVVSGKTITATVSGSLLPSTGFANKLDYTWNLWPRDTAFAGVAAISDFAPNNTNFTATPVPEPASAALLLGGLGLVAMYRRRQSNS